MAMWSSVVDASQEFQIKYITVGDGLLASYML